jgi:hypothetical protein
VPTKKQLSEELNEMLDMNMEWDRLLQEDLEHLHQLVESGALAEPVAKQYAKKHSKQKLEEEIDSWYPGKIASKLL